MAHDDGAPSSRDVAGEDFLFHLYRGSELLQDNRVHEAKGELEQALNLQPLDPKGQDLLAIVYFRLGLYPRAITIYEQLIANYPTADTPRINLALSYLKTGQPARAREALETVLQRNPNHARAWGYLGLAFQRMGDYERAAHAFAAGGHEAMSRKLMELAASKQAPPSDGMTAQRAAVGAAASQAFDAIDEADGGFKRDQEPARPPSGMWAALEPGLVRRKPPPRSKTSPQFQSLPSEPIPRASQLPNPSAKAARAQSEDAAPARAAAIPSQGPQDTPLPAPAGLPRGDVVGSSIPSTSARRPSSATRFARDHLLVTPRESSAGAHPTGLVVMRCEGSVAARFDAIRSMAFPAGCTTSVMKRRSRARSGDEPLGGPAAPLFELGGHGTVVLGPPAGRRLVAVALDQPLYLRESSVIAFDGSVDYENGRLPLGEGEAIPMVQLRGDGVVVAALPNQVVAVEVEGDRNVMLRALSVLGWVGRVTPRALPPSEAPAGVRGFATFGGDGMILLDVR